MIETIETKVNDIIQSGTQISREIVDVSELESVDNLISLAGENYPAAVSLISGAGAHTEPCCGTHLLNTRDIGSSLASGGRDDWTVNLFQSVIVRLKSHKTY